MFILSFGLYDKIIVVYSHI